MGRGPCRHIGHRVMTAEQMAELAAAGRYWWMRRSGTVYATEDRNARRR